MLDYRGELYTHQLANSTGKLVLVGATKSDAHIYHYSSGSDDMKTLSRNNRGTATVEVALVTMPIILFIVGIIQTACIVWADNLLHIATDTGTRCGAVTS